MAATPRTLDLSLVDYDRDPMPVSPTRDKHGRIKAMTRKQMRARARRQSRKGGIADLEKLYKPIEEWDAEELARGRPRNKRGDFTGRPPGFVTRELHEEAMTRFRTFVRDGMNANTNVAIETIEEILKSKDVDDNGKPVVTAATKLEASKYLIDHVLGKPKQRVETDISVKLQGLLATAVFTPNILPADPAALNQASPRAIEDYVQYEDAELAEDDD